MSAGEGPKPGEIGWIDIAVADAERLKDFYARVAGWVAEPLAMGGYSDYVMTPPGSDKAAAGICHARGGNADLPAQWLIYITVADLDAAMAECGELGGEIVAGPKGKEGSPRYCVIRDPAGAVATLYQP